MYFGRLSNEKGYDSGILSVSPKWVHIPISLKLDFEVINNAAENKACFMDCKPYMHFTSNTFMDILP